MNTDNSDVERLKRLPRGGSETWEGGFISLRASLRDESGKPYHPTVLLWVSTRTGLMEVGDLYAPGTETYRDALELLADFATNEEGYRPDQVEVDDPDLVEWLQSALEGTDINVTYRENLAAFEEVAARITRELTGKQ